ncbi:MAG TPA: tetratricopeptide repeat protein, partial [Pyrinomonadaceae bacterium]|nr:tetratricopeptide repeat protein [Pyrinomonadaceae bacterium]
KALEAVRSGKEADAIKMFDKVLAADPKDYEAWTELGNIYFRKGSTDNAEAAYFKAIELKRDYFLALLNLGKLYFGAKRFDDAILVLSNATKANSESADAYHFLGESYLAVKKGSLAVPAMNNAIKLAPTEKAELHLRLASLYDAANLKKRAADEYKLFLEKKPDHPDKAKYEKYIAENK